MNSTKNTQDYEVERYLKKTLDKISESLDLKMLSERIAERHVISCREAKLIILKRFGEFTLEKIENKRKSITSLKLN